MTKAEADELVAIALDLQRRGHGPGASVDRLYALALKLQTLMQDGVTS